MNSLPEVYRYPQKKKFKMKKPPSQSIILLFIFLILSGCASSPDSRQDQLRVEFPGTWEEAKAEFPHSQGQQAWVNSWQSDELRELLIGALENNFDLKIAASRLEGALARSGINNATGIPTISATAGANRQKFNTGDLPIVNTTSNLSLGLTLNWEVDLWGQLRDQRSAAIADAEGATFNYNAARLSLMTTVAKAWFNWIEANEQLTLAEASYESFNRNAERAKNLYERGVAAALDYQLLKTQAASAEAFFHNQMILRDQLGRQIRILMGEYPSSWESAKSGFPKLPDAIPAGVPSDLLINRPDVLAAERSLAAAEKRFGATRKERLPSFSLTASAGASSRELNDLTNGDFSVWSLLGNLTAPIFQAGKISNAIAQAKASYEENRYTYEKTLLTAFQEVEQALSNESMLKKQNRAISAAAESAKAAELIAWQRYQRGLIDIVTVLETQRRSFDAQASQISSSNRLHQNRLNLLLAIGSDPFTTNE